MGVILYWPLEQRWVTMATARAPTHTADCLALASAAILMRLIEELAKGGVIANPTVLLRDTISDPETCPESSTRVEDAIKMIRKEMMPRILESAARTV